MHDSPILGANIVPDATDLPDVPTHVSNLINAFEPKLVIPCTSGARPTGVEGMTIFETDTNTTRVYDGTKWTSPGVVICTSGTRPGGALLYRGLTVFETDTGNMMVYYGGTTGWKPPWSTAWGILDYAIEPDPHLGFDTTPHDIHADTRLSWTAVGNRLVKVTINAVINVASAAPAGYTIDLYEGTSPITGGRLDQNNSVNQFGNPCHGTVLMTPAAGTRDYRFYITAVPGSTGLIGIPASATFPITTMVEDMGPTGNAPT